MSLRGLSLVIALLVCSASPVDAAPELLLISPEPAADPWWQRARWQPRATVVRGVAIRRLHPDWCAAEAFSRELIGQALPGSAAADPLAGLEFAIEGSFDGSGRPQMAFVGAYRRCAGESGFYLAIVEPFKDRPRVRFLVEVPNAPGAIATVGREPDGTLAAWWCVGCDSGVRIEFNREAKGFFVAGPATRRQ